MLYRKPASAHVAAVPFVAALLLPFRNYPLPLIHEFGSSLLEQWDTVGTQLLCGRFIFALILHYQHNRLCLDQTPAPVPH